MSERREAVAANGLPERNFSRVPRVVAFLAPAALVILAVACNSSEEASQTSRNIHDFDCGPDVKVEDVIRDENNIALNRIIIKLPSESPDALTPELAKVFEEHDLCVLYTAPDVESFELAVDPEEKDGAVSEFQSQIGKGLVEVKDDIDSYNYSE